MSSVEFTVHGLPKPQPRPRMNTKTRHVYNPSSANDWKDRVMWAWRGSKGKTFTGPVILSVIFCLGKPERGEAPYMGKPDLDNLVKSTMDALTTVGAWEDDSQVCELFAQKLAGHPSAQIRVEEMD